MVLVELFASAMYNPKVAETATYTPPSTHEGIVGTKWQTTLDELKHTFLTKDGWIGDYVYLSQRFLTG